MHKLIPILALGVATVATVAVAAPAKPPKNRVPHFGIDIGMQSSLSLNENNFDYFIKGKYNEGRLLYTSATITRYTGKVWGVRAEQGVQVTLSKFTPSVALYYAWAKVDKLPFKTKKMGYNAGLDYHVNSLVSVGASMDDFATRHAVGTLNATVHLGYQWRLIAKVHEALPSKDKSFSVALGYRFG